MHTRKTFAGELRTRAEHGQVGL